MDTDNAGPTGHDRWHILAMFNVSTTADNDQPTLPTLADAVCELCLPSGTLERLSRAVEEALLTMTAQDPARPSAPIRVHIYALAVEDVAQRPFHYGWGFFVIEKRGMRSSMRDHPIQDQIELHLYQDSPDI